MKEIKLNKLSLRDFQGGTLTLDAKGQDIFVFGQNAVGKTRIVSAFSWLLFNKDALGRSEFEIKNLDAEGRAAHGLEHTVWADLLVDGKVINLKKVYREKWQKKRGLANKEFTGHTTDFFIDGVPIQEKDYNARIAEMTGDESRFRLLTSPMMFPSLHWQTQRKLLLEICGDVLDEDVIHLNEKLAPIMDLLGGRHTLEDHRKIVTARRSEINKEMEKIPVRIDEVRRGIPDVTGIDRHEAEKDAQALETALNDAKLRLQGVNTGGNIADLTKKLTGLNADLRKMEEAHRAGSLTILNRLNQQISEIGVKLGADRRRIQGIDGEVKAKAVLIQRRDDELSRLRKEWTEADTEAYIEPGFPGTCYACGQTLPTEQIQGAKEKSLALFNQNKAERLSLIDRKGKEFREQRDRLAGEIDALKKEREIVTLSLPETEAKLKALTDERDTLKESSEDFSGIPHWSETFGEIEAYEEEIKSEREGVAQDAEKIKEERAHLQGKLTVAKDQVDKFVRREQGEKRIEELKKEEKNLSMEFEKLEGELYLMEAFIRAKVSMLTTKINEKFETVRFKLFDLQVNGALAECCEITVNGVPFDGGLNNGARINAGLEIVKVMQQHYQLKAPVFADNAEAVNSLFDVGSQMIRLYVSEDKTLRVEIGEAAKAGNTEVRSRSSARRLTLS